MMIVENRLNSILEEYQKSFTEKVYPDENDTCDLLMAAFGITPELKREHRQYWGRELGKCWERLVIEACRDCDTFRPALKVGNDEPCDLVVEKFAIDTKYRIGSGDAGTLKKFKGNGELLQEKSYKPTLLILREDNLPAAINACKKGQWEILIGSESFDFIKDISNFDMKDYLTRKVGEFHVNR